ncbi:chloroplast ADP,ATP carrier protein [Cyanidioschyzon merolae strain 10D]|jgi:AAA family ATP:ADP antiporter|uniref:ADP,ATP carrier protein n=1 Tax=Cyanidioschyzon merolae (strain NIES-3377 / 10D) TaxID=280699 RepID=M1V528_CYAM1|nr:chloroplast ADP,ATP carrier protein [Cyanidioschyzon merolae strain 10D]BAM79945.1 chloroplast ADP,ATP carrier protein [Cyanidioschyzon merolae strain 10D]|eukprot:XP_005536231.1 chloroplast ADP,ATP carrier protein [Cyanidioschyzon merolae strain 10D]
MMLGFTTTFRAFQSLPRGTYRNRGFLGVQRGSCTRNRSKTRVGHVLVAVSEGVGAGTGTGAENAASTSTQIVVVPRTGIVQNREAKVEKSIQQPQLATAAAAAAPASRLWGTPLGALVGLALGGVAALLASWQKGSQKKDGLQKPEDQAKEGLVLKADASAAGSSAYGTNGDGMVGTNGSSSPAPPSRELRKIIPLGLMFFLILFNYTILRDTKDVLVVTAAGAEIIPFLKTYANLPGAVLFTILYSKLTNVFSRETVFYICIAPFLLFFLSYAWFLYPNRAFLHPSGFVSWALQYLPPTFAPPLAIIGHWTSAVFYTLAELWGSVVVSLLFWGFANEVTTVDEAKKWYPVFGLMANVALIFSGQYVRFVSDIRQHLPPGVDGWLVSLRYLMGAVAVCGSIIVGVFYYMQRKVMTDPTLVDPARQKKAKTKTKLGLVESAKFLAASPYIRNLALLVIAYGMSINIVEVSWKSKLREQYPDPNAYSTFMGWFSTCTGSFTIIMMLASRIIFRRFGWGVAAMITPITLGITGMMFFALTLFAKQLSPVVAALGTTPLFLAVLIGAAQNIASKGSKYSLFDPCKEMAYIPLDAESKSKGKAAIDVIGNPLGKSGGSFIQQALIFATGSLAASTPFLAVFLASIIIMWLAAARSLDRQFTEAMAREQREAEELIKKDPNLKSAAAPPS